MARLQSLNIVFQVPDQVVLKEEPVEPPGQGEVVCRAERSLISIGTEMFSLAGIADSETNWSGFLRYPFSPGYSMVGQVIAIGEGVKGLGTGDRVTARAGHRQLFTARAGDLAPVPDAVSAEDATWATLAYVAQLGIRRAELRLGERIGVVGLGILGQLVVQYLALCGARQIVAIDPAEARIDLAAAHGATHVLPMDVSTAREAVREITGGAMLDAVFDITGNPGVLGPATRLVRQLGRVILLGDTTTPSQQPLGPRVVADSVAILGIHGTMFPAQASPFNPWTVHEMIALFFDYLQQGRMRVADLVTHRVSPLDAPAVYRGLREDRSSAVGIIFDWSML
jgi:2-desacetyl-2-hydroxyethyl bacteriochlorophyllide A dehydrogenase